ncbi:DNA-binding protein [Pseudomonas fluorescens]|uniref:DNA-binding protein n=1 Tax=Pseudomonas fluorescens TaxID=294 RepID=A0A854XHP3_PSEFL|nr:autoinducer binding domain-containing protein [Pseudomonas fluorescens]PCM50667.1 DNA-binding protein [Pseudomonas fluorescens]
MSYWQAELLENAMSATDVELLFDSIKTVARQLEFDYVAYGARRLFPITKPCLFLANNYSPAWQAAYSANRYLDIDPYVQRAMRSVKPVLWDAELKAQMPEFWQDAQAHGLSEGWGQTLLNSETQGLVTFARGGGTITAQELETKQAQLSWLAQITHLGLTRLQMRGADSVLPVPIELSQREKEILQWTADGKSSDDVSVILGISKRTVNFHINHCLKKLGCQNKIAAAVKASLMGLLWK